MIYYPPMTIDREHLEGHSSREYNPWWHLPGQVVLHLSKARLVERTDGNERRLGDNIDSPDVLEEIDQILTNRDHPEHRRFSPVWNFLKEQVSSGHKVARFAVTFGAITITIASLGYEVIGRHGKDIKYLFELLEEHKRKKQQNNP